MAGEPETTPPATTQAAIAPEQPANAPKPPKPKNRGGRPKGSTGRISDVEYHIRIAKVADMLAKLERKCVIIKKLSKKFKISESMVEKVHIPAAEKQLRREANMTPEQAKDICTGVLQEHIRNGNRAEQARAVELLAKINMVIMPRVAYLQNNVAVAAPATPAMVAAEQQQKLLVDGAAPQKPTPEQLRKWLEEDSKIININAAETQDHRAPGAASQVG